MNSNARLSLESVTYAMQARDLLSAHGIGVNVVRLNRNESGGGCAFGIELLRRDVPAAISLLKKADIFHRVVSR